MRMLLGLLLVVTPLIAEDQPDPLALFATEFVAITPGQGQFPKTFMMGAADDPAASPPRAGELRESTRPQPADAATAHPLQTSSAVARVIVRRRTISRRRTPNGGNRDDDAEQEDRRPDS